MSRPSARAPLVYSRRSASASARRCSLYTSSSHCSRTATPTRLLRAVGYCFDCKPRDLQAQESCLSELLCARLPAQCDMASVMGTHPPQCLKRKLQLRSGFCLVNGRIYQHPEYAQELDHVICASLSFSNASAAGASRGSSTTASSFVYFWSPALYQRQRPKAEL